ncbi:rRNA maturation RNase YbeY [Alteriqipengyuania sp. 357]
MQLEIDVDEWPGADEDGADWHALATSAAEAAARAEPALANARLEASILFTSNEKVHELNRDWREKDKPTNVLSFPMLERDELVALDPQGPPVLLGDIALARETCAREAAEKGVALADHASHLVIHGLLHLAGLDHEISTRDAEEMEALEVKALAQLGIADPYGDR